MLLCAHAGLAALLGQVLPGRTAAILAGIGSHAALDAIRHEDNGADPGTTNLFSAAADTLLTLGCVAILARHDGLGSRGALCAIAGALPDLEQLFPWNAGRPTGPGWLFPSHALGWLHSSVLPLHVSLRAQAIVALVLWLSALMLHDARRAPLRGVSR